MSAWLARLLAPGMLVIGLAVPPLPPCQIEDGSAGPIPCRWDATTSGNGRGVSFTITVNEDGQRVFTYDDGSVVVDR